MSTFFSLRCGNKKREPEGGGGVLGSAFDVQLERGVARPRPLRERNNDIGGGNPTFFSVGDEQPSDKT